MKQYIVLLLALIPLISFGQTGKISTLDDEYKYLTRKLRDDVKAGKTVDFQGYRLEKFFEAPIGFKNHVYQYFKFINTAGELKAIYVKQNYPDMPIENGGYWCVPINNEELMQKFLNEPKPDPAKILTRLIDFYALDKK